MNRSVGLHLHHVPDRGFVPVSQLAEKYEFVAECVTSCPRLAELLDSKIPDTETARKVITERLDRAESCIDGPHKRLLGRMCCSADM